jgi:hypothetical protein
MNMPDNGEEKVYTISSFAGFYTVHFRFFTSIWPAYLITFTINQLSWIAKDFGSCFIFSFRA